MKSFKAKIETLENHTKDYLLKLAMFTENIIKYLAEVQIPEEESFENLLRAFKFYYDQLRNFQLLIETEKFYHKDVINGFGSKTEKQMSMEEFNRNFNEKLLQDYIINILVKANNETKSREINFETGIKILAKIVNSL